MVFYSSGEILSKYWGLEPKLYLGISVIISYSIGTICWLGIMIQKNELALMSCVWAVLTTIISVGVGILAFHEKLTTIQWFGVIVSAIGLILLSK